MHLNSFKARLFLATLMSGAVILFIGLTGPGSWAAPGQNPVAQTIPTRSLATPTDLPPPAPTAEPPSPADNTGGRDDNPDDPAAATATIPAEPTTAVDVEPTPTGAETGASPTPGTDAAGWPPAAATGQPAEIEPPPVGAGPDDSEGPVDEAAPTATLTDPPAVAEQGAAAGESGNVEPSTGPQAVVSANPPAFIDGVLGQGRWLAGLCLGGLLLLGGILLVRYSN
jgi:hypothetical protein